MQTQLPNEETTSRPRASVRCVPSRLGSFLPGVSAVIPTPQIPINFNVTGNLQ